MGGFGVFPAPGQAHFEHQRHLRWWAENFQKVWYEKNFVEKILEKLLSFPEIYFGHPGTISRSTVNRGGVCMGLQLFRSKKI